MSKTDMPSIAYSKAMEPVAGKEGKHKTKRNDKNRKKKKELSSGTGVTRTTTPFQMMNKFVRRLNAVPCDDQTYSTYCGQG